MPSQFLLHLALPTPLRQGFDYLLPTGCTLDPESLQPGMRVRVPFGRQELVGILLAVRSHTTTDSTKLRAALEILDGAPVLPGPVMRLCQWCADYYQHPLGEVLQVALPGRLRKAEDREAIQAWNWQHTPEGKGLPQDALRRAPKQQQLHQLLLTHGRVGREMLESHGLTIAVAKAMEEKKLVEKVALDEVASPPPLLTHQLLAEQPQTLNAEQQTALDQLRYHHFASYLLEGATGSGKTEVYLQAINRVLQAGRQALVLVPEIGLTPQTLRRIEARFRVPVAELHSNVSEGQRARSWAMAASGDARIVIGTRLAAFTPMPDLGLIIVDEEHDLSFKQQEGLRYSARDIAVVRASQAQIPIILGSATPSLETLYNAIQGRYEHLRITRRAGDARPPAVELINLRDQRLSAGLAQQAQAAIEQTLQQGHQVLVFLNRRGYAPALLCHHCGWHADCNHCDTRMTLHQKPRHLRCHHCDTQRPVPFKCPTCHSDQLMPQGQGTEKAEELMVELFPEVPILRVDRDSMSRKHAMQALTAKVMEGEPCILVGTQMLAKGHHFPKVALVVILDADQGLMSPDFRGPERMGQLIMQVSGRAGRGDTPGKVFIQSHKPEHPLLQTLIHQGYHRYARQLLAERRATQLPPFSSMVLIRAESKRAENAIEFLQLARRLAQQLMPPSPKLSYLGPIPALMERRQGRYRYQLQITGGVRKVLQALLTQLLKELDQHALARRTRWSVDVDPMDMG
jgi:primosomal protein N' (replication factor Y)